MPKIGDIIKAKEKDYKDSHKYIWTACPDCKKERWVQLFKNKPKYYRCIRCANTKEKSSRWKGGKTKDKGYIRINQGNDQYFKEHRLIMAKFLGRSLIKSEIVHHINGIRDDNKIENLKLMTISEHITLHRKLQKEKK